MLCGVDEAGRGPVIGPLVVAGVIYEDDSLLIEYNIRDSKKLTPRTREILADKIKKSAKKYEILIINAEDIDDMRKVMTLNDIEVNAFSQVIKKLEPDFCYVDAADVNEKRFGQNILSRLTNNPKILSKHKADETFLVVGAASILAKTTRDNNVKKIAKYLQKKLNLPLGSGYPADPTTKKFLRTWIETYGELPSHVRQSWKTSQKLLKDIKNIKLDVF
jgi:ribonuclease HII